MTNRILRKARSITFWAILFCTLSICASIASADNLLVNGDAELGNLTGWTISDTLIAVVTDQDQHSGTVGPHEGIYFFSCAANPGSTVTMTQSGFMSISSGTLLMLEGYVQTENLAEDDFGTATIRAYDEYNQVVASAIEPILITSTGNWILFNVDVLVPTQAVKWEVELKGTLEYGLFINVFWDALNLSAETSIPALSEWFMFGFIIIMLICGIIFILRSKQLSTSV